MKSHSRHTLGLTPQDFRIFLLYTAMLCVFIPFHEPWADEAQAWLLSRDLSIPSLLFHGLRHEGHPALWYLLLWLPTHLGFPYFLFSWLSGAIATVGIWVLLRYAPFPFYLRALLPFTFFLGYQYAIVARSYVLFPLLGFLAAHLYRRQRPVAMAWALSLLANVSLHGTLVALAFAWLYANRLRKLNCAERPSARQLAKASALFSTSIVFVAVCLWPTAGALPAFSPAVTRIIDRLSIPENAISQPTTAIPRGLTGDQHPGGSSAPVLTTPFPGEDRIKTAPLVLAYAFAKSPVLAIAFQLTVLIYLARRRQFGLAIPFVVLSAFLIFVYRAPWHLGLLWVTIVVILWAAWDTNVDAHSPALQNGVAAFFALLCVLQLPWTPEALFYDLRNPVSPDKAAADYLRTLPAATRIAGFGMSAGVQPYFRQNIFYNQPFTFGYLGRDRPREDVAKTMQQRPDIVVADPLQAEEIEQADYQPVRIFCGKAFFPNRNMDPLCLIVFKPRASTH